MFTPLRINRFVAQATGLSRRAADTAIREGKVTVNGDIAELAHVVQAKDVVTLDGILLDTRTPPLVTIMLNKPVGYVCSRSGQGSKTVYELLPESMSHLKTVGRLDKDSSGLLLLTNDGNLAHQLTHPRFAKEKVYQVRLDKMLTDEALGKLKAGVKLDDGPSQLRIKHIQQSWYEVRLSEGRNRQIRRTFTKVDYKVVALHRIQFGRYHLGSLQKAKYKQIG